MKFKNLLKSISMVAIATVCVAVSSCNNDDTTETVSEVVLANHSVTPALVKKLSGFESLEVYSLIGSDDNLPLTSDATKKFVFGGSADGLGILKNTDGTYTMLTNHEDNFAVSRVILDKTFKPIKGEYLMNSNAGVWRLCSATLATQGEHGFGPIFLTSGESGQESRTHAISPYANALTVATASTERAAFGRFSAENALPLASVAYPGKTTILIGDDDSGTYGGQVAMFTNDVIGDLNSGKVYYLRRTNLNQKESDIVLNQTYSVEFVEVPSASTLTGLQLNEQVDVLKAIKFGRVEDLDYRKGGGTNAYEVYFNVTGQNNDGNNADNSRTKYGRVYRLKLDQNNRFKGTLEVILDGDKTVGVGNATMFQNPDNICVTNNYVYVQEDANSYGDETHDAYIYQYNIATKELKTVIELDHRRTAADAATYNVGGTSSFGRWEYGAMNDISDIIGIPNTFAVCIQPHTWTGDKYKGVDGGTVRPNENQASQIVIIKGLAK